MWIIREANNENNFARLPVFYKRFRLQKKCTECVLKISALGIFNVKINGVEIDEYFMPGWTNYNRYVHLCAYDITKYLKKENLLEITISDGWYSGRLGYTTKAKVYGDVMALYAELSLTYQDGEKQTICTDESWRVGNSRIVVSSLFDGETVDFRTPKNVIDTLPFAKEYPFSLPFVDYSYEPVKQFQTLTPTVIYRDEKTVRLDFGQNFAGFLRFTAVGESGSVVTVRHAEVLNGDGSLYYENLRSVKATDRLILSGGKDEFDPKFTFHGFRYAEIALESKAKITKIKGVALSQAIAYGGKFACSDKIVNKIYQNVLWGQKSNFISIPTDCPQRDERLGWTGDAQVFCNSAMFNANCEAFLDNYLKLVRTDVQDDGKIPSLVPFFIKVSDSTAGVPGWADAICVIPYYHYLHYRNKRVVEECLPFAVRHVEYYLANSEDGLLRVKNPFGDWLSVERADDVEPISQCFLGLSASLLSKLFGIVGDGQNEEKYADIYEKAKAAFRRAFLQEDGKITGDSQTVYAFALSVGFVKAEEIRARFIDSVRRAGNKLTTGFVGVKYLLPALCEIGETDLAYRLIKETEYPSWGYTIKNGATTIWERWNGYTKEKGFETPSMNSFNHYSLGSCVEWLYSHVLGIKLSIDGSVVISPSLSKQLSFAKGEYASKNGVIRVEWKRAGDGFTVKIRADKGVNYSYDFGKREILSTKKQGNVLHVTVK